MNRRINVSVESIMVILLMIIFAAATSILIFEGSITYRNIINNKTEEENTRIALSYVNMRVKQNDVEGNVLIQKDFFEGQDVLTIHHHDDEEGLLSYIYFKEGYLWECYTDGALDHSLSTEIIPIEGITFETLTDGMGIKTSVQYKNNQDYITLSQISTMRSVVTR